MNFVQRLRSLLARNHPAATLVEMRMPSGNVWVDIKLHGTLFVVQYDRSHGFGVSAIRSDDGFDGYGIGHDKYFARFSDAQLLRREEPRSKRRRPLPKAHRRSPRRAMSAAEAK
jgi:hypothetical protein